MSRRRGAVVKGRSILALDTLGEIRRAMRILRRVEKYLVQQERRAKRPTAAGREPRASRAELASQP